MPWARACDDGRIGLRVAAGRVQRPGVGVPAVDVRADGQLGLGQCHRLVRLLAAVGEEEHDRAAVNRPRARWRRCRAPGHAGSRPPPVRPAVVSRSPSSASDSGSGRMATAFSSDAIAASWSPAAACARPRPASACGEPGQGLERSAVGRHRTVQIAGLVGERAGQEVVEGPIRRGRRGSASAMADASAAMARASSSEPVSAARRACRARSGAIAGPEMSSYASAAPA